jgi:hypothetical protein
MLEECEICGQSTGKLYTCKVCGKKFCRYCGSFTEKPSKHASKGKQRER